MKKLLGLLIVTGSVCYGQTVTIPDSTAAKIILELGEKDGLVKQVTLLDSLVVQLEEKANALTRLTTVQDSVLLLRREQLLLETQKSQLYADTAKDMKKLWTKEKRKHLVTKLALVGETAIFIIILLSL
jgi:hypothetical protein